MREKVRGGTQFDGTVVAVISNCRCFFLSLWIWCLLLMGEEGGVGSSVVCCCGCCWFLVVG